jgi:hypothetical protein
VERQRENAFFSILFTRVGQSSAILSLNIQMRLRCGLDKTVQNASDPVVEGVQTIAIPSILHSFIPSCSHSPDVCEAWASAPHCAVVHEDSG